MTPRARFEAVVTRVMAHLSRVRDEEGQSMVEYALLLCIISVTLIVVVATIGKQTNNMFSNVTNGLNQ